MSHSYNVGTRAWQPDSAEGWVASEVIEKRVLGNGKIALVFALDNEEVRIPNKTAPNYGRGLTTTDAND